ncbi:hypothetical protein [Candidatus Sulfurimonas baltica]|uniref:Uncharacterized protein n=1 Tax=Candidatus Sulfurimonas baltica TaxID=2740404 RepID=A0A7S7RLT9_9BACT|nr:hypothetical protein [Candidatus Sulfurimonas baltica]QOY50879.1 hypothetical protein HUE88_06910 [Candidatus Sulfurimonas baltica]
MQAFGKFSRKIDLEYIVEQYIYIQESDETIDSEQLEQMLKHKRKTVIGTIFLYNPTIAPIGYKDNASLDGQGYEFKGQFDELAFDKNCTLFASAIKDGYRGKLIEIKYLFGLNKPNIEPTPILEEFDGDLDRYTSNQLTRYDKELNYQDYLNIRLSGKFVFFASGNKYDRHHKNIIAYARNLSAQAAKLGKHIAFMYDNNHDAAESQEVAYFLPAIATGKLRDIRANSFKRAFKTNPPSIVKTN